MRQKYLFVLATVLCSVFTTLNPAHAQGTAFTYQGRLNSGGAPASGSYDLAFTLFGAGAGGLPVAGPVTNSATLVSNGLFTTTVDFGPGVFIGGSNWLEIAVSSGGANSFTTLTPRQPLTPAPYAIYAEAANATNLVGTIPAAHLSGAALRVGGNTFSGNQIVTNGVVGIGVPSPVALLEARTSADTRAAVFSGPGGGGWSTYKTTGVGNPYLWDFRGDTNGYAVSRSSIGIDLYIPYASGNVGIGTTTPAVKLDVNGDINSNGKSVPVAPEKQLIVRGIVKGDATVAYGSGWTVARTPAGIAVGDYLITFNQTFLDIPSVTTAPLSAADATAVVSGMSNGAFNVRTYVNGVLADVDYFNFIAIGVP